MSTSFSECSYTKLPGDVYEIVIHQPTRQAVLEFFEIMRIIYSEAIKVNALPVRTMVITPTQGPLPVIPLTAALKSWTPEYGKTPARFVIVYEGAFAAVVDVMMRTFGKRTTRMRVFKHQQRDEALAWLMQTE